MSMPNQQFLRLPTVMANVGKCRSSIYQEIKKGTFPAPIKIGPRAVAWSSTAIADWQEERINDAKLLEANPPSSPPIIKRKESPINAVKQA